MNIKIGILVFVLLQYATTVEAQAKPEGDVITEVLAEIIAKLDILQRANVDHHNGGETYLKWNLVKELPINYHLFELTFLGYPNGNFDKKEYQYRVDLSKVRTVTLGKASDRKLALSYFADSSS